MRHLIQKQRWEGHETLRNRKQNKICGSFAWTSVLFSQKSEKFIPVTSLLQSFFLTPFALQVKLRSIGRMQVCSHLTHTVKCAWASRRTALLKCREVSFSFPFCFYTTDYLFKMSKICVFYTEAFSDQKNLQCSCLAFVFIYTLCYILELCILENLCAAVLQALHKISKIVSHYSRFYIRHL